MRKRLRKKRAKQQANRLLKEAATHLVRAVKFEAVVALGGGSRNPLLQATTAEAKAKTLAERHQAMATLASAFAALAKGGK